MTVLLATPWPLRSPGGGQRLAHGIADALAGQGIDVVVAAGSGLTGRAYDVVSSHRVREVRLQLAGHSAARGLRRRAAAALSLSGLESLAAEVRPDVLLFTPHYSSCAVQAREVAESLGIPIVMWPAIHLDHADHTSRAARQFYRSCDRVLCLSAAERDWLRTTVGIPAERLLIPGYPWRCATHVPPRSHPAGPPARLLSVGAFVPYKQFADQIEAVAIARRDHNRDVSLTLAGAVVEPSVIAELEHRAKRLGVAPHIAIVTNASDEDIAALHTQADAFLFTSRSESFGVALLEAIGRATPPVVYPHPIYRRLVEASGFGRVTRAACPEALAEVIAEPVANDTPDDTRGSWLAKHSSARVGAALAAMLDHLDAERVVSRR